MTIPTADGEETIEIKPGTQPGTEIRLRGRGVPHLRRAGARGDLHVLVDVTVPTKLTKRQRELLAEFAAETGEAVNGRGEKGIFDKVKDAINAAFEKLNIPTRDDLEKLDRKIQGISARLSKLEGGEGNGGE